MIEYTDKKLMKLIRDGDAQAFETIYHRYNFKIYNYILRYTGNCEIAQDLLQETFTRVWTAAHTFRLKEGHFKAWLYKIALNLTRSEMSKKRYAFHYQDITDATMTHRNLRSKAIDQPDTKFENLEIKKALYQEINKLKPHHREVIIMKLFQQLKFREIAQITDTPEGTIKARFHHAVAQLKKHKTLFGDD